MCAPLAWLDLAFGWSSIFVVWSLLVYLRGIPYMTNVSLDARDSFFKASIPLLVLVTVLTFGAVLATVAAVDVYLVHSSEED